MKHTMALTLMALVMFGGVAAAHPRTPGVDRRQASQQVRIAEGLRDSELTRGEARRLRAGQKRIRRMERRAKADGVVTQRERARLERAQDRESRAIRRLKHNDRNRDR